MVRTLWTKDYYDLPNFKGSNIPEELREKPNWGTYFAYKGRKFYECGKFTKRIVDANDGNKLARVNDPKTWATFDTAFNYAIFTQKYRSGLAYALDGTGITCIDLDELRDENGEYYEVARKCLEIFKGKTYIERSVSGNGIHIFFHGNVLDNAIYHSRAKFEDGSELEVYDNLRFISMTGDTIDDVRTLGGIDNESVMWLRGLLGIREHPHARSERRITGLDKTDEQLLDEIRKSRRANELDTLLNGPVSDDHSRDDYKLMCILSFFSEGNAEQIERIFRASGLFRPEKSDNYIKTSIKAAIANTPNRSVELKIKRRNHNAKPNAQKGEQK